MTLSRVPGVARLHSVWAAIAIAAALFDTSSAATRWPYDTAMVSESAFETLPLTSGTSVLVPPSAAAPELQPQPGACGPLPDCCPGYRLYAFADVLLMARYAALEDRPLAFNEDTGATVLSSQDLQWAFAPGVRAFIGERGPNNCGWEAGYLGLYGMNSSAQAFGIGTLSAPGDVGQQAPQFNSADLMTLKYTSMLNMAEVNFFKYDCCGGSPCGTAPCGDACGKPRGCRCIDWLGGVRWGRLNETANFTSTCCDLTETSTYDVSTYTNMLGGQLGLRYRRDYERWGCEGWVKAGLAGVWMGQTQQPILNATTGGNYREGSSSTATSLGGFTDVSGSVIYRISRIWGLRAGLDAIWLSTVALAPNQWDFTQTDSVTTINSSGLFLLGGHFGAEARW